MKVHERYLDQMLKKSNDGDALTFNRKRTQFPLKEQPVLQKVNRKIKPSPRRRNSFSPVAIVFTMVGIGLAYFGYENSEAVEKYLNSVQFSFMTLSQAEEKSHSDKKDSAASDKPSSEKKPEQKDDGKVETSSGGTSNPSSGSFEFDFVKDFKERKKSLDQKEEELKSWETEIQNQKADLDTKIKEIQTIRKEISAQLEERVKADQAKIDTLVQVYTQMKASQAAKVFENLDEDLAVDILTKMKKKNAADILNLLKADRAQVLSEKYAGYARKPAQVNQPIKEGAPVDATKP